MRMLKKRPQVQVKTIHSINISDLAGKLNIQNPNQLSKADQEKIQSLLRSYMNQGNQPKASAPAPKASKPAQKQEASKPAASKEQSSETKQNTTASSVSAYEKEVVDLTNAERTKRGLKPLKLDEKLAASPAKNLKI